MIIGMANRGKHSAPRASGARRPHARGTGAHSRSGAHYRGGAHAHGGAHYRGPARKRSRRRLLVAVAVVALVAVGAAALVFGRPAPQPASDGASEQPAVSQPQQDSQTTPEQEYANVVALVNQADRTVVPLSKLVSKTFDDRVAKRTKKVLKGKDSADALLEEAASRLEAAAPRLEGGADGERADVLSDAIGARRDMLRYGGIVLQASAGAYDLTDEVVGTWQHFLDGVSAMQDASESVAGGTTEEVKRALSSDRKALSHFKRASSLVEKIASAAPNVDLSAERGYASLQEQACEEAIASDEALLDEDAKRARKHNGAFREKSAAAAKTAKKLPATTDDLVKSIYYSLGADGVSVQEAQNSYETAAKRAAKDDRKLAGLEKAGAGTAKES